MRTLLVAILVVLTVAGRAGAAVPNGFVDELVASGLSAGTAMAFAPDGRLFVCQQTGAVRVIKNGVLLAQPFITPSYVLAYRADLPVLLHTRLATPLLLSPDFNVGGEIAQGVSYFFNSGVGLTSEIALDLFYGAATLEEQYSVIPILNFQFGVIADYEFLP